MASARVDEVCEIVAGVSAEPFDWCKLNHVEFMYDVEVFMGLERTDLVEECLGDCTHLEMAPDMHDPEDGGL